MSYLICYMFFCQAEDGIRDAHYLLEFRRVLFRSSVANISFFFPKSEKGSALALNSGLGNVGVSLMQFLVPLVVTMSLFGALGGQAQTLDDGTRVWIQNAGFVWVPLIMIGTLAAGFGMNDRKSPRLHSSPEGAFRMP